MIRVLVLLMFLTGCTSTTVITDRSGGIFQIESQKDAIVTFKDESVVVTVDNRGRPSTLDELIKLYFMKWQAEQATEE
ncbi:MAG: hypothetical protein KAS32_21140 [Candidatus Peribacteraceae bacterium]|nr:hypothetical protein [Candidatus Peribacteraceae bacterium]